MVSQPLEEAVELLRVEYLEMPDLALTPSQVAALLDLDGVTTVAVLRALEDSRFLERTPSGRFIHPRVTILT
jgi:DNA-binding IclR family transcriptional regulator